MRPTTNLPLVLLALACTSRPLAHDDEAGTTTVAGSTSSEGASASETGATTGETGASASETVATASNDEDASLESHCDPFMQDCPEGEKCVAYSTTDSPHFDTTKCVPVVGDQAPGEPCIYDGYAMATDDCDATSTCWYLMEIGDLGGYVGTCVAMCTGSADIPVCPEGTQCSISGSESYSLCLPTCDPLAQDCDEGLACHFRNNHFFCEATTENIPTGEPCGYVNDCAPGNLCADAAELPSCAGSACCTQYCDLQLGDAGCLAQPGTACVPFFEQGTAPAGYENVGVCIVPQ